MSRERAPFFGARTRRRLARSLLTRSSPVYVQYYVTARCNLACEQCNVIYANADVEEASTEDARRIAENLAAIGTSIVLLTGGEPFLRKDLPEIVRAFGERGIHVRLQTNGAASPAALEACVAAGARDISISLDSLAPELQDSINGGFPRSWERAIRTIALVNRTLPEDAFAALGCVLAPRNLEQVTDVVRFADAIGWYVSLVPAHTTPWSAPMSFRTTDPAVRFPEMLHWRVESVLDEVRAMRDAGSNVYDSDAYLDDVLRYVRGEPVRWRDRNGGVCDSPDLYFAVLPNGDLAVCCDHRLDDSPSLVDRDFPERFWLGDCRARAAAVARVCPGCMFGSFPEMSITARYLRPLLNRTLHFQFGRRRRLVPLAAEEMFSLAAEIRGRNPGAYARPAAPGAMAAAPATAATSDAAP